MKHLLVCLLQPRRQAYYKVSREKKAALNKTALSDCLKFIRVREERMVSGREFQA